MVPTEFANNTIDDGSDAGSKPRDFSLIDSASDNVSSISAPSLPHLPLPTPRSNKPILSTCTIAAPKGFCQDADGQSRGFRESFYTRSRTPNDDQQFCQSVVESLRRYMVTEKQKTSASGGATQRTGDKLSSGRRRRINNYASGTPTLSMGVQEALDSHYEQWTSSESNSRTLPPTVVSNSQPIAKPTAKCREVRVICTYIDYDANGNRSKSLYSMKMMGHGATLRRFKKIMPHPVKQPRFFFRNIDNESNIEIDEDDAQLPVSRGQNGEPLIVAEIISKLN